MTGRYDAIIIGAGIIGACTAYELAKRGWRTLNVDRLPAAGYGSTGASCAIIRTHYSTLDGSALAYEGFFYWDDWAELPRRPDERGLAEFHKTGCLVMKTAAQRPSAARSARHRTRSASRGRTGDRSGSRDGFRSTTCTRSARPSGRTIRRSARPRGPQLGAVFFPCAGYIGDPQLAAHNAQRAAEAEGRRVPLQRRGRRDPAQGWPGRRRDAQSGEPIDAPVVVNVAGPHSYKINRMAGVEDGMTIRTRALKQEVAHVPFPAGFDFERDGPRHLGFRRRLLLPPRDRQPHPDRQRGPAVRSPRMGRPRRLRPQLLGAVAGAGATGRPAHPGPAGDQPGHAAWSTSTTSPTTGSRSTTSPTCRASTWRSAPAAISSRTRRSRAP